jgi:hypothetical protein
VRLCAAIVASDGPPGDENIEVLHPLMMKIQTRDVTKCIKTDGRTVHVGDIVWGVYILSWVLNLYF